MEPSDPSIMILNQQDCYFYYYSSCSRASDCPYRHEPAALGNETVCRFWAQGNCSKPKCIFRHMNLTHQRNKIPCYFEKQPGGCKKVHCPFFHNNVLDQPRAEDIEKKPDLILPISTSPQGSNASPQESNASPQESNESPQESDASPQGSNTSPQGSNASPQESDASPQGSNRSSPSSSRSHTPVSRPSFIISLSEDESDGDNEAQAPAPVPKRQESNDENYLREIELVKKVMHTQAEVMGHTHVFDNHQLRRRSYRQPNSWEPQHGARKLQHRSRKLQHNSWKSQHNSPQPMFVDEVEDVIEEIHDDIPKPATTAPPNGTPATSTLYNIAVIESSRGNTRRSHARPSTSSQTPAVLTPDYGSDQRTLSVAGSLIRRRHEMRARRSRQCDVTRAVLANRVVTRFNPTSVQRFRDTAFSSSSVHNRLEGRVSSFSDVRADFSPRSSDCDKNDFQSYSDSSNSSTSDPIRVGHHYGARIHSEPSSDEYNERAYRTKKTLINHTKTFEKGSSDSQLPGNRISDTPRNGYTRKRGSSPSEIRIKSLDEIRKEKAKKTGVERVSSHQRDASENRFVSFKPKSQAFTPSVLSQNSASSNSWNSSNSSEDMDFVEHNFYDPVFGCTYGGLEYEEDF